MPAGTEIGKGGMGIESKERWDEAGKGKKHERWVEREREKRRRTE